VEVIEKIAPFASKRVLEYGTSLIASTFSPCTETARPFGILSQEQARQCDGLVGGAGARYGALVNHNNSRIAFSLFLFEFMINVFIKDIYLLE